MSGIYQIQNLVNKKKYIGSSKNIKKRINKHFRELTSNRHPNIHLQASFNKYKRESFIWFVLEEIDNSSLIKREQHYIDTLLPEYNKRIIASSNEGSNFSQYAKMNMSKAMKGEGNNFFGKKHSEETKLKMRIAKLGKKFSKEAIAQRVKLILRKVYQYDLEGNFIKEYSCLQEAAIQNNFDYKWFTDKRKLKNYIFKGHYWIRQVEKEINQFKLLIK